MQIEPLEAQSLKIVLNFLEQKIILFFNLHVFFLLHFSLVFEVLRHSLSYLYQQIYIRTYKNTFHGFISLSQGLYDLGHVIYSQIYETFIA
jgi:hypothetical protein